MRDIILSIFLIVVIMVITNSCANPGAITGGEKDTIPPTLISSIPENGTINYRGKEFTFTFDEKINADQLKTKLLITPYIDNPFKHTVKRNILIIQFEKPFNDSTTYILNFADGVGDLNEKNPVINFRLAFSTTDYIDSLSIKGAVKKIKDDLPAKKYLVTLYVGDTSNVLKHKPTYFSYTDTSGIFTLENIKASKYRIYAYDDENKNLILDPKKEAFGFLEDTLLLNNNKDSIIIYTQLIDATPFNLVRKSSNAPYYEVKYSKYIDQYNIEPINKETAIPKSALFDENTSIRFYNTIETNQDSTGYIITSYDSLKNELIDTVFIKFQPSKRKPPDFKLTSETKDRTLVIDSIRLTISANKPITTYKLDTINLITGKKEIPVKTSDIGVYIVDNQYNKINLKLIKLSSYINSWQDSITSIIKKDSLKYESDKVYQDTLKSISNIRKDNYTIQIQKGNIISIESDTAETFQISYVEPINDEFGSVSGNINTTTENYIVELINKDGTTVQSLINPKTTYRFNYIKQGNYSIRILIPKEGNTTWSYGNLLKHKQHDKIIYTKLSFEVRPNWELEKINITF